MLRTFLGLTVLLLVTTAIYAAPEPAIKPPADIHVGEVMAVTEDTLMLMDERDLQMETFAVTAETKITFNGNPATLLEVQMGDRARVTGNFVNERLVAVTITAFRPL
jgi:hypothetical protein